jgi:hypothetical protein
MFELRVYDRLGNELNEGDLVLVSGGQRGISFYCEVKYLEEEQAIAPFHTFCFHSFEKVDKLPEGLTKMKEERFNAWYAPDPEKDNDHETYNSYFLSWVQCEHELNKRSYRITKKQSQQLKLYI